MKVARAAIAVLVVGVGVAAGFAIGRGTGQHTRTTTAIAIRPAPGLTAAVERTRARILAAAQARDFDRLARIAGKPFEYTFGPDVPGGPAAFWRRAEQRGDRPLETLAAIMEMPYTLADGYYVWPFAYDKDPEHLGAYERRLLAPIADAKAIAGWKSFGGYLGWRAGIAPDGRWQYYVAGD